MSRKRNEYLRTRYSDHLWQAYIYFEGICQKCGKFLELDEAVLHHLKYSLGYMDDPKVRINEAQLLCKYCHKETHYIPCGYCSKLVHKWRAVNRMNTTGADKPICHQCYTKYFKIPKSFSGHLEVQVVHQAVAVSLYRAEGVG